MADIINNIVGGRYYILELIGRGGSAIVYKARDIHNGGIYALKKYITSDPVSYTHLHIYDKHVPLIEELLTREQHPAPKLWINPEIKNFYDFTVDDLKLEDYVTGPQIKNIPVAV